MNGWALGGLACFLYAFIVGGLALKKSPGLVKVIQMKLGKRVTDQAAIRMSLVMAAIAVVAGVVLLIMGSR